ncbi:hypothetical protein [Mumia sp. Pv 4-285]|uniref:hypothetical protein n=1 Tax=Mumia qirimensis TaxID=3234852 RepID=UPI00351D907B
MFDGHPAPLLADLLSRAGQVVVDAQSRLADASAADLAAGAQEVEVIAACERVRHMVDALQLDSIAALDARRRITHAAADPTDPVAVDRASRAVERSVRAEVSMARGVSTEAAQRSHDLARALRDHPRTRDLLTSGVISTAVARAVCRETSALPPILRRTVDADLGGVLPDLTLREAGGEARRIALALDPEGAEVRAERARAKRSVRLRRNADAMATLSVYGPAEQVVAAWNHLARRTLTDQATGRAAGRGSRQITCDLALAALRADRDSVAPSGSPGVSSPSAEIGLLMRPEVLFGAEDTPAVLEGYGPIPAGLARRIATDAAEVEQAWVRRLFTTPTGDRVTGVDSRRRRFPAGLARMVRAADDTCLRPSCDEQVRDLDHLQSHARGGTSTADNAGGACQSDNLVKEMRGWSVTPITGDGAPGRADDGAIGSDSVRETSAGASPAPQTSDPRLAEGVRWRTPTGHTYATRRAGPAGRGPARTVPRGRGVHASASPLEAHLAHLVGRLRQ